MKSKVSLRQLSKDEWQHGPYIEIAMISVSSEDLSRNFDVVFEEFWEDGLGRARSAGFLTPQGKQFSIVEYLDASSRPATYILISNDSTTKADDLLEALKALEISPSELIWSHADVESDIVGG